MTLVRDQTRIRTMSWLSVATALVVLSLTGCELPEVDTPEVDLCQVGSGTSSVAGNWTLSARGERNDCSEDNFNGDFTLETSMGLTVVQDETGIGNDTQTFALKAPINFPGGSFTLNGTVRGTCVDFEAVETYADGGEVSYVFTGQVQRSGRIDGEFVGRGPVECSTDGNFDVRY